MRRLGPLLSLAITVALGALACGGSRGEVERPSRAALPPGFRTTSRVRTIDEPDRPLLRLMERQGDPRGAVAVSVFTDAGSRGALGLAALLESRLRRRGATELESTPYGPGVVLAAPLDDAAQLTRFFQEVEEALATSVGAEEPGIARANALLVAARQRIGASSEVDECLGRLGAEGQKALGEPFDAASLDELRARSHAAARVGFAVLGPPPLLEAARTALAASSWPAGEPPDDRFEAGDVVEVGSGTPERELTIAARVANASLALGAVGQLGAADHPLQARLAALPGEFVAEPAELTFRPRGACLAVTVRQSPGAPSVELDGWAAAALIARAELFEALEAGDWRDDPARVFLSSERAVEAASLGAWTSLRRTGEPAAGRSIVRLRAPTGDRERPSVAALTRAMERTASAWSEVRLPLESALETGQGEAWLLVASPCGTAAEAPEEAGFRALAVRSLAADFDGTEGVTLEAWYRRDAVGLLAHAAEREGESTEQHGARLARVLALALAGSALDGRDVAAVRDRQLEELGENPARALALSLLSGGAPSRLEPRGAPLTVAEASTSQLERVRARLVAEPLRAALLVNGPAAQARAVERTLAAWLAPLRTRGEACPQLEGARERPGVWTLGAASPEVRPMRFLGVALPGSNEAGQAWAWLLNRPGGYLERALAAPEFVTSAEARFYPGGGLIVALSGEAERLDASERQVRGLLDGLARAASPTRELSLVQAEQKRLEEREAESPRGRVVRLWFGRRGEAVTGPELERAARGMAAPRQTVVRLTPQN